MFRYIKTICFANCICGIHQPIFCTFASTNSPSTLVIRIRILWKCFIVNEPNLVKLLCATSVSSSFSGCHGSRAQQRRLRWMQHDVTAASVPVLPASFFSSVYWLMNVSQNPDDNSRCDITYRMLFFCNWRAHGSAYMRNTDDWLVEPHCSMFLQGY